MVFGNTKECVESTEVKDGVERISVVGSQEIMGIKFIRSCDSLTVSTPTFIRRGATFHTAPLFICSLDNGVLTGLDL